MKIWALLAAVAAVGLSGGAFAQTSCPGDGFNTTPFTAFAGKTVCVGAPGNWEAQEMHGVNFVLKDYKKGADDLVDPTTIIGTWNVDTSSGVVTYVYSPGSTYSYKAYVNSTTITDNTGIIFCPVSPNPGTQTTGTLRMTPRSCD